MMRAALLALPCALAACVSGSLPVQYESWQISDSGDGAFEASVASSDSGIVVTWYDERDGNAEIYLSLYDPQLKPLLTEQRLTDSPAQSYEADAAWLGNNIAVAWYDIADDGTGTVRTGLWNRELVSLWQKELTMNSDGRIPELLVVNERLFIAWLEREKNPVSDISRTIIMGAWLDQTGDFSVEPFPIAPASDTTWNINADVTSNQHIALVYDAQYETETSELYLTLIEQSTPQTRRLTTDDGNASKYPDLDYNGTHAAISWHDERDGNQEIYLDVIDSAALSDGNNQSQSSYLDETATRITSTTGASFGAYLDWNSGRLGLIWCDNTSGNSELFFSIFNQSGNATAAIQQLTNSHADSLIPSIEAFNDEFIIAWNEAFIDGHGTDQNNTRSEIHAVRLY